MDLHRHLDVGLLGVERGQDDDGKPFERVSQARNVQQALDRLFRPRIRHHAGQQHEDENQPANRRHTYRSHVVRPKV
jgi:hypothetical protein